MDISLTEAEKNELAIIACCHNLHDDFLQLGGLLLENYEKAFWSANKHESFKDFIGMLGIGYSWATRLMGIAQIVAQQLLTQDEVKEIGVAKATLLLPYIKRGKLNEDIKLLAKNCPFNDLRKALGHNIKEGESEEYLLCPRCGVDITFHKGMLRRR
jgi:hypothetical protein